MREKKEQARYVQIAQSLIQDISKGIFAVGSAMPAEVELSDRFGVSRNTMREAIRILLHLGLVVRHRGIGTIVQRRTAVPRFKHKVDSRTELFSYEQLSEQRVLSSRELTTDGTSAQLLGCSAGERWVCLETLRSLQRDQIPIAYSNLYLPRRFAAIGEFLDGLQSPSYATVEQKLGLKFARVTQENSGHSITGNAACHLKVPNGSAALYVVRGFVTCDNETLFVTETYYPEGRFSFSFEMTLPQEG
jgi:DNA-binding GntR family transcriptional regulator